MHRSIVGEDYHYSNRNPEDLQEKNLKKGKKSGRPGNFLFPHSEARPAGLNPPAKPRLPRLDRLHSRKWQPSAEIKRKRAKGPWETTFGGKIPQSHPRRVCPPLIEVKMGSMAKTANFVVGNIPKCPAECLLRPPNRPQGSLRASDCQFCPQPGAFRFNFPACVLSSP